MKSDFDEALLCLWMLNFSCSFLKRALFKTICYASLKAMGKITVMETGKDSRIIVSRSGAGIVALNHVTVFL
jgi:hypothetical protein